MLVAKTTARTVPYDLASAAYADKKSAYRRLRVPAHLLLASFMSGVHTVKSLCHSISDISRFGGHLLEALKGLYNFAILLILSVTAVVSPTTAVKGCVDQEFREGAFFTQDFYSLASIMDPIGNLTPTKGYYVVTADGEFYPAPEGITGGRVTKCGKYAEVFFIDQTRGYEAAHSRIKEEVKEKRDAKIISVERPMGDIKTTLSVGGGNSTNVALLMESLLTSSASTAANPSILSLPVPETEEPLADSTQGGGKHRIESRSQANGFMVSKVVALSGQIRKEVYFNSNKFISATY